MITSHAIFMTCTSSLTVHNFVELMTGCSCLQIWFGSILHGHKPTTTTDWLVRSRNCLFHRFYSNTLQHNRCTVLQSLIPDPSALTIHILSVVFKFVFRTVHDFYQYSTELVPQQL
eukprot:COSAG02_NODE_6089_length_3811_cov_79.446803_6_plen_116_part_00